MQFRVDLPAFQGDFLQAYWRQVKGNINAEMQTKTP